MNCERYKNLIEKYIAGQIESFELIELKAHYQQCNGCNKEMAEIDTVSKSLKTSFESSKSLEQVAGEILAKIDSQKILPAKSLRYFYAAAAVLLFAIGLAAGLIGNRMINIDSLKNQSVPLAVNIVDGMVLVKHKNSAYWEELKADSKIYLGDTFHTATKAVFEFGIKNKSAIKLEDNSVLLLKSFNGETEFYLQSGFMHAALESPHQPFFVSTPNGRVEALGTEFTVKVEP